MFKINPLTQIDFYKADHRRQYPEGTTLVYSNFTPRSSRLARTIEEYYDDKVVFFGLQGFIKWFLIDTWNSEFFEKDKGEVVAAYKRRMDTSLGPDAIAIEHIEDLYDLGYLPIKIKALPEGSRTDSRIPVFTIENTLPDFFWLTNYLESVMSAEIWKPCTTATISNEYRKIMTKWAEETGAPIEFVQFQGHDFSFRGMSGMHDAAASGAGHLLPFVGTDSIPAIDYLENYYNANAENEMIGTSVPATEHSVMCMGGMEDEVGTFKRLITEIYPEGIISIVSDTWDFWKVITEYTVELKEDILNRTPNALGMAKVVFRPDSGNPVDILCGDVIPVYNDLETAISYVEEDVESACQDQCGQGETGEWEVTRIIKAGDKYYQLEFKIDYQGQWQDRGDKLYSVDEVKLISSDEVTLTPAQKGAIECLWDVFSGTETEKGYKVLNERVGLIYGDSITLERADEILKRLAAKGFASCNTVFGIGSYTYQFNTRDTFGFAMKATYGEVNGEAREIFKDPITDSGTKKSARGLLSVQASGDGYVLKQQQTREQEEGSLLKTVFLDGELVKEQSLQEIRDRLLSK